MFLTAKLGSLIKKESVKDKILNNLEGVPPVVNPFTTLPVVGNESVHSYQLYQLNQSVLLSLYL